MVKPSRKIQGTAFLQREPDGSALCGGLVNGQDHFHGFLSILCGDQRLAVMLNGIDHIRIQGGVAEAVNIGRILGKLRLDLRSIVQRIGEIPLLDLIDGSAAGFDRTLFTEQIQSFFQISGVNIGGAFDYTVGAVSKLHNSQTQVFRLDIIVLQAVGVGHDLHRLAAHHPDQQVDVVDALVHQTAAVLSPGASPLGPGVILPVTGPADMGSTVEHPAEAALFHSVPDLLNGFVEPVLVADADFHTHFLRGGNDGIRILHGQGNGLFNDDVAAGTDAVHGDLRVQTAFGADGHQLGFGEDIAFSDVSVVHNELGKPELQIVGGAKNALKELTGGDANIHLSISDQADYCAAMVVIEKL